MRSARSASRALKRRGLNFDMPSKCRAQFAQPAAVSESEVTAGGRLDVLLPAFETLPEEFRRERDPFSPLVHQWFFRGLNPEALHARRGINAEDAWRHLRAIMASWDPGIARPQHVHKIVGVAYLMSLWFDPPQAMRP